LTLEYAHRHRAELERRFDAEPLFRQWLWGAFGDVTTAGIAVLQCPRIDPQHLRQRDQIGLAGHALAGEPTGHGLRGNRRAAIARQQIGELFRALALPCAFSAARNRSPNAACSLFIAQTVEAARPA
jgi:hypothetical protein